MANDPRIQVSAAAGIERRGGKRSGFECCPEGPTTFRPGDAIEYFEEESRSGS